jgi:predicted nuclease with RNAse H fold
MLTLGIDLSAEPKKTAAALIGWSGTGASLESLDVGADDETLLALIARADKVGIDCPLGWPVGFVDFVIAHRDRRLSPGAGARIPDREALAFRVTDRYLMAEKVGLPLSVSTDRIGRAAMRVAGLLASIEQQTGQRVDRAGNGKVVEVYPAAALRRWGFTPGRYKSELTLRRDLVDAFTKRTGAWLQFPAEHRKWCEKSDDAFDAVIASLNARAATVDQGVLQPSTAAQIEAADVEGWIAVPQIDIDALDPSPERQTPTSRR